MLFYILFRSNMLPAMFGLHSPAHPHSRRMCLHALTHTFTLQQLFLRTALISREPRKITVKYTWLTQISSRNTIWGGPLPLHGFLLAQQKSTEVRINLPQRAQEVHFVCLLLVMCFGLCCIYFL